MAVCNIANIVIALAFIVSVDGGFVKQVDRSSTLSVEEPLNNLSQQGLKGVPTVDDVNDDLHGHYEKFKHLSRKQLEKLKSVPNHWDIPLIPTKDMTWTMFVRHVEREVLLAVHEGYLVAWCVAVTILLAVTGVFVLMTRSGAVKDDSETCKPFEEIATGETENGKVLVQKGYGVSAFGAAVFWMWVLLPLLGYLQMALIALDHYFFVVYEPDLTWNQWAQPYLLVFVLSHVVLFLQTQFLAKARVFFMLPAPLHEATKVLIQEADSVTADGTLVEVEVHAAESQRYFEYTCIRYIWSDAEARFLPVGTEAGLSGKEAARRIQQGGLTTEQLKERQAVGPNIIHVPVPGVLASLAEEFLTPLYCFQFAVIWLYLFIDSWNIAAAWCLMTLISGICKSLFVVRKNRLQVQEMARTVARATVMREGKWVELDSPDIVPGDVIQVDERVVCCDIVMVKGGAVVNESMLTGEPMPVQRFSVEDVDSNVVTNHTHKKHLLFTGTIVMQSSGDAADSSKPGSTNRGIGVVFNTGPMTMKGSLIRTVLFPEPIEFKFTDQLPRVYLIMFIYVCCLFCVLQLTTNTGSWIFSIYIGFTILAQSLNPLLPVSVTLGQTMTSDRMKKETGISCLSPQRLPIAGKVHIMVMDKTGTITKEGMEFRGAHVAQDGAFVDSTHWAQDGKMESKGVPEAIVWALAACHTVTRLRDGSLVGNMVEVAMLNASGWELSEDSRSVRQPDGEEIKILKQLEFDQKRMTSGSVIQFKGKTIALVKGSYERIGELVSSGMPGEFKDVTENFASDQYYVLGIGMKILGDKGELAPREELEKGLSFVGLFLFRNEMKSDSPDAVAALREGGTRAIICTGDNALTGAAIGRRCGCIRDDQAVILGDVDKGAVTWTNLADKVVLPHKEVMESHEDAELVLTKAAFKQLQHDELVQLIGRVRVYARMKPDDKVAVVQLHQLQGWVVGMVGDGGNDCGAMRAAHVGLALSEAEASIVAPFSSGATYGTGEKSLMAVPHLLRYGRATLQTNTGTFLFFTCYGLTLPSSKLVQLAMSSAMMSEWCWLFIDILLGIFFVMLMTNTVPSEKLAKIRPTSALLEGRTLSSVGLHVVMFFSFYFITLNVLWAQPFHVAYDTKNLDIPAHEWTKKGDNYDCAITFLVLACQLVTAGYAGTLGAEHRQSVWRNWGLTLGYVLTMLFFLVLILGGPTDFHCIFRVNCDNKTSRQMYVPFVQEFSAGNVGGCFLGPQLEDWKEQLGDKYHTPDEASNMCFPGDGFDPEKKLSVASQALFGLGKAMCYGPNNCFSETFRVYLAILLLLQSGLSIGCHKLLLLCHPAGKEHFKVL
jgi:cation-transporting ATPase 13A3/4/5